MRRARSSKVLWSAGLLLALGGWLFMAGVIGSVPPHSPPATVSPAANGGPRLVAVEPLSAFQAQPPAAAAGRRNVALDRPPLRVIKDQYPTYSAVALDLENNEIVLQDENLFQIMAYDRQANTPARATMTEPKRIIGGLNTKVEFNCGLYIDPKNGDIYSVNND